MKFRLHLFLLVFLAAANASHANNYNVTNTADGTGTDQLRGAINSASGTAGPHTITVNAGTYNITMGEMLFGTVPGQQIMIIGSGTVNVVMTGSGTNFTRFFKIGDGLFSNVKISITGINFSSGKSSDAFGGGAILCGGPGCVLNLSNCTFNGNVAGTGNGGAVSMQGGGSLVVKSCTFTNNSSTDADGGAVDYYLPALVNSANSLIIDSSNFSGNAAKGLGSSGGAINIATQGKSTNQTFIDSIQKNNFDGNSAVLGGVGGGGGAINAVISLSTLDTLHLNLNRFYNNSSLISNTAALSMAATQGSVDAVNNWWNCNAGPVPVSGCGLATITAAAAGGSLNDLPYLVLTATAVPASICNAAPKNTSVLTASFLKNSANNNIPATDLTVLIGRTVSFSGTGFGSFSPATMVLQPNGTAVSTFTATTGVAAGSTGKASFDTVSTGTAITITASSLPAVARTVTQAVGTNSNVYQNNCEFIATVVPLGSGSPLSGNVTAKVWIESSVMSAGTNPAINPYVQRHYEITPTTGTDATVTLYFTQAEFDAFNAHPGSLLNLPTNSGDLLGKASLRIGKYSGSSNDGTGHPSSYTNGAIVIDPPDNQIVYNSALARWEVTFDVTGFSGFVVQTSAVVLPVTIVDFSGRLTTDNSATLYWDVALQQNIAKYVVQKSSNGYDFTDIGDVNANTQSYFRYSFIDAKAGNQTIYYRLRIINSDGHEELSKILTLNIKNSAPVLIYPNPSTDAFTLQAGGPAGDAVLFDVNGRNVKTIKITGAPQKVDISMLAKGLYLLKFADGSVYKITKQ